VEGAAEDTLPRATQTRGSTAELTFVGTGIEYIAQKCSSQGDVDIYLDQVKQGSTSLNLKDFPVFLEVSIFSKQNLPKGEHVIKVVSTSESRINLEAFRVYA
jgi:hypothetical protein